MTDFEDDTIEVVLPDVVRVALLPDGRIIHRPGLLVGEWYVWHSDEPCAVRLPTAHRYEVGHNPSGCKIAMTRDGFGLTFWEALRFARAVYDAYPVPRWDDVPNIDDECLFEAVFAASLMDHYVFPIDRYMAADPTL